MACVSGICAAKFVAGVVGVGAAAVLGFNWITTGCPTGVCRTDKAAQVEITPAAHVAGAEGSCCALMAESGKSACGVEAEACVGQEKGCCSNKAKQEVAETKACCSGDKAAEQVAQVIPVASTSAPKGECCADKGLPEPCDSTKPCCIENYGLAEKPANP